MINFSYDSVKYSWCEITLAYPVGNKPVDLSSILKELASKSIINQVSRFHRWINYFFKCLFLHQCVSINYDFKVPGIRKAAIMNENGKLVLKTDGLNIPKMVSFFDLVDLNKIYLNDVHAVASTYGIEAAQKTLVNEIINVFKVIFVFSSLITLKMLFCLLFICCRSSLVVVSP